MTKQLRLLTLAAMMMLPLAACDEGTTVVTPPAVTGSIAGTVSIDGAGAAGVTVTLSSGKTATTSATGTYTIADVAAGAYTVTISGAPTDVAFTSTTKAAVVATAGQIVTVDFAGSRIRTSAITGSVTTTGGVGLGGVTVTLSGTEAKTTTTGTGTSLGQYSLTGLRAGTYTVAITTVPAGNTCATPTQSVTVAAGEVKVASFACTATAGAAGSISGKFFNDANGDSIVSAGEPTIALSGVNVRLEGPVIGTVDNTLTVNGLYSFANKAAGTYSVSINPADPAFAAAGFTYKGPTAYTVVLAAGGARTADFPFVSTNQTVRVFAYMGRDRNAAVGISTDVGTADRPAPNVIIDLYPTESDAINATNRLGRDTTDAAGMTEFTFLRTADTGPGGTVANPNTDQIVFASFVSAPAPEVLNGEARIEVRYTPTRNPDFASDTFDILNPTYTTQVDVQGFSGSPQLVGWNVNFFTDTTVAAIATVATGANGKANYTRALPSVLAADIPDTLWYKPAAAQAAAAGHAFTITENSEAGTVNGSYIRYVYTGTRRTTDTVDVGDSRIKFSDADIVFKVHHELDDSTNPVPYFTAGDAVDPEVASVTVQLQYTLANGTVVTQTASPDPVNQGFGSFLNVPTGRAPYRLAGIAASVNHFVLEEDTLFTVGQNGLGDMSGSSPLAYVCPLQKPGGTNCSTFAVKDQNSTLTINVRDASNTVPADSVKIRVRSDPRTIQGRPVDTLLTVGRNGGGVVTLSGMRDGFYIISPLHDSINAAGDTVWAFVGAANQSQTIDVTGPAQANVVSFVARRGDTQIQGFVVNDRDQDLNTVDPNEGLTGMTVSLYRDGSGTITLDTLVKTTTTDANGAYTFSGLREGTYAVKATSPSGAIVLRRFTAAAVAVDTAVVHTKATAAATCQNADNLRRVGTNDLSCYGAGNQLPRWDYTTSTALNVIPASFTFLNSNGTVQGFVKKQSDNSAIAGMTVSLRRCLTSAAPATPTGGTCTTYDTNYTSVNSITDATGKFTFPALREGVYEATPSPATVSGFTTTTPTNMLFTINQVNDVETGNFTAQ